MAWCAITDHEFELKLLLHIALRSSAQVATPTKLQHWQQRSSKLPTARLL
jgi:hypothetical protein